MRVLAITALFCCGVAALADDKKDAKKPEGSWAKKESGFDIKFTFKKGDVLVVKMSNGADTIDLEAKCTFEKDGVVKCKTTKFTKEGNGPDVKAGDEFTFKIKFDGKKAKLSDIESKDISIDDAGKNLVQGDYEMTKE